MTKTLAAILVSSVASLSSLCAEGGKHLYAVSGLNGLIKQIGDDLKREEVNVVIGRLSDYGNSNPSAGEWEMVRKAQVKVAEDAESGAWVDTDDLNDGLNRGGKMISNDLHYSAQGYVNFGTRLADAAIGLIEKK